MRKMRSDRRFFAALCAFLAVCAAVFSAARAEVYTSAEDHGASGTIYVAGAPDCYPVEYYDPASGEFHGVIPDILREISAKTGISFTYISASEVDRRKELARNNQAELITALEPGRYSEGVDEMLPVLEAEFEGRTHTYCIGFTEIASPELRESIKSAFAEIPGGEIAGFLITGSRSDPRLTKRERLIRIFVIADASVIVAAAAAAGIVIYKKRRARRETMIDEKTGIGNAKYLEYAFGQMISRQSRELYSLLYIAFDTEKAAKKYAKSAVDDIERYAAANLNSSAASAEYLARTGDGVFAVLAQTPSEPECRRFAENTVGGLNGYIRGFYPDAGDIFRAGVSRLCEHPDCDAETAFYNAKQGYLAALRTGEVYALTDAASITGAKKRDRLAAALPQALKNGEFRVLMQLIADGKSGRICGAEALSRWQSVEYGMLYPTDYIDLLRESGDIVSHDYNVFSAVCAQLAEWNTPPYDCLFMDCNFTRISLSQEDFAKNIADIASHYDFDHSRLVIEITEDSSAENSAAESENIRSCREMGVGIAIDDIGKGFSSIADIYDNEIDLVKSNKEFISACTGARRQTMLSDIITLVHHSGARVICEGVETERQVAMLSEIGCDMMQGYYFSRVIPKSECARLLTPDRICENPAFSE